MEENANVFSFGKNWQDYLKTVSKKEIDTATRDIVEWLGANAVLGQSVVDIGSGSGIHSRGFHQLGAKQIYSFDYDPHSVEATRTVWEKAGRPENWTISHGSILDEQFMQSIGQFDIVYSWGVLHHTGALWQALEKTFSLVKHGGIVWISLYAKGPRYAKYLRLKQKYNAASRFGKRWMICKQIGISILSRIKHFKNPFTWNETQERGMNSYHDIVDWLGGLPYEEASEAEVLAFGRKHGLILEKVKISGEGGCSIYVFSKPSAVK